MTGRVLCSLAMTESNDMKEIVVSTDTGGRVIATALALALATAGAACGGGNGTRIDASPADARPPSATDARRPTGPDAAPPNGESDEFNGSSLDESWNRIRDDLLGISVSGGELHLVAEEYSVWFEGEAGGALYKGVAGDFKATTSVKARKESDPSQCVGSEYQFGGVIAFNPNDTDRWNYVFVVVGDRGGYLSVETKSTINSSSDVEGPEWPSCDAELRLCRIGSSFHLYKRAIGATTWTKAIAYDRPDLPATLNVGPFAYAYTRSPDLRASFAHVAIEPAASVEDCTVD